MLDADLSVLTPRFAASAYLKVNVQTATAHVATNRIDFSDLGPDDDIHPLLRVCV